MRIVQNYDFSVKNRYLCVIINIKKSGGSVFYENRFA